MQSSYYELSITPSCDPELLSEFIEAIYDKGYEVGESKIIITDESSLQWLQKEVEDFCKEIGITLECSEVQKQNSDWIEEYKSSVKPIEVERFYIRPSWCKPKEGLIDIVIDPALSFGSGHHATTYSCLQAIGKYCKKDDRFLDVGCGSGILSISAAKLGASVDICDSDEQAIESSLSNFTQNGLNPNKKWIGSVNKATLQYDFVVANIVADILIMLQKELQSKVIADGYLVLSGILNSKADEVKKSFTKMQLIEEIEKDEWVTLVYRGVNEKL